MTKPSIQSGRIVGSLLLTVLLLPGCQKPSPYSRAKVGDWADYTMIIKRNSDDRVEAEVKVTVISRMGDELTLRQVGSVKGVETPPRESKIDVTKRLDPMDLPQLGHHFKDMRIEKLDEGKENLKVGNRFLECKWIEFRVSNKEGDNEPAEWKIWVNDELFFNGLARYRMTSPSLSIWFDIIDTGSN